MNEQNARQSNEFNSIAFLCGAAPLILAVCGKFVAPAMRLYLHAVSIPILATVAAIGSAWIIWRIVRWTNRVDVPKFGMLPPELDL